MTYEVEMKFPLPDGSDLEAKLVAFGAEARGTQRHADRYFRHPNRDFARTDEALRLRSIGDRNAITYKGPKIDPVTKTRQEIEIEYASGNAAVEKFRELLNRVGFTESLTVRKTRRIFELTWRGRRFEVVLDDVDRLGRFAEIETLAEEAEMDAAKELVLALASELGLQKSERRGYLQMLLEQGNA